MRDANESSASGEPGSKADGEMRRKKVPGAKPESRAVPLEAVSMELMSRSSGVSMRPSPPVDQNSMTTPERGISSSAVVVWPSVPVG